MVKTVITLAIVVGLLAVGLAYFFGVNQNKELIDKLNKEKEELVAKNARVEKEVEDYSREQGELKKTVEDISVERDSLKNKVAVLETERKQKKLDVRRLRDSDAELQKLISTYRQLNERNVFIFEHPINESGTLKMNYAGIPASFLETFIIEHNNSKIYLEQRDLYADASVLADSIITLQDSINILQEKKTEIYKDAYEGAYQAYMKIHGDYIKELEKPRFELPHWGAIVGGAAAGYLLGKDK